MTVKLMTEVGDDTQPAMAYPTKQQYTRWKEHAEEYDMSVSEFMASMIEAGMKKFDATVAPDETNQELRQQRNDLKDELVHARDRVQRLENRLHRGERETIRRYVEDTPGTSFGEIVQQVIDTVPERVNHHLDGLEGEAIRFDGERYYPVEDHDQN